METIDTPKVRVNVLESVLEKVHANAKPMVPDETPPETKKEEPKITAPAAADDKGAAMATELAAAKARIAELEGVKKQVDTLSAESAPLKDAQKLWKEGKKLDAIAKLAELEDIGDELDDVLVAYAARPGKEEKNAVETKLDAVIKRMDEKDSAETKRKEDEAKAGERRKADEIKKVAQDAADYAGEILTKFKDDFELCNKEKHRKEVCEKTSPVVLAILERDKIAPKDATREQVEKAMKEAFSEFEKALEEEGKSFYTKSGKRETEKKVESQGQKIEASSVVSRKPEVRMVRDDGRVTVEKILEKARKSARYQ